MNFTLQSFILAFMAVTALLTESTTAAEGSNQLRGADHSSKGISRHLEGVYTAPASDANTASDADMSFGSSSGGNSNTGSTYTPPPPKCPVKITLNSIQGGKNVSNGSCPSTAVGGGCAYAQSNKSYAQCDCVQASRNRSEWQCYPNP